MNLLNCKCCEKLCSAFCLYDKIDEKTRLDCERILTYKSQASLLGSLIVTCINSLAHDLTFISSAIRVRESNPESINTEDFD